VAETAVEISRAMGWTGDASSLYTPVAGFDVFSLGDGRR
jgi:hypothetical protein